MSLQETIHALIEAAQAQAQTNRETISTNREVKLAINRVASILTLMQQDGIMSDKVEPAINSTSIAERITRLEVTVLHLTELIKPLLSVPEQIAGLSRDTRGNKEGQNRIVEMVVDIIKWLILFVLATVVAKQIS